MKKLLTIKDLSYAYERQDILSHIHMHVDQGEIVSLLGPSGVGKSTLFHLIAGILPLQSGQILLDGSPVTVGQVSYMLQKDLLLEHKTVLENSILPLLFQKVSKTQAIKQAEQLLSTFHLQQYKAAYPHELSGGMRQRVALLRTYLFGHRLFLLDEPFSALDELTKMELHHWYMEVQQRLQLTTLLITHNIEEALHLSHRIYIVNHRPAQIVGEIVLRYSQDEAKKERQTLAYKKKILSLLGLNP